MEDRYEIREKIGQGGIGSVHRAYDHKMSRHVAIKRILTSGEDPSLETEATKQMMAEVGALSSLQHPHIVTVFDVGSDEEGPFVVMELINGKTLDEIVENAPLTWDDFKIVAMQSLEALIAAHDLDMIHSDLKPPNIMLSWMPSGAFQIKIVDFGLATLIHNQSQEEIEKLEAIYGSVFFMPPEQYERKTLDARSDVYSLGCCFYQALAGSYPFNGNTGMEVMQAHLDHTVRPIHEIRSDIPQWACDWVMSMILRHPGERPPSAREALTSFVYNDKKDKAAMTQEAAGSRHTRLITSKVAPTPATGSFPTSPETSNVHAAAPPSPNQPFGTPGASHTGTIHIGSGTPGNPTPLKKLLKIAIPAAAVLLIVFTVWLMMKRNEGIRQKNAYTSIIAMAAQANVKQVHLNGDQLKIVFDFIVNSMPDANLTPAYEALTKAASLDGTNIDSAITDFTINANLPGGIRQKLFQEVIGKRESADAIPALTNYIASARDPDEAIAAFDAIRPMVHEEHADGLLGIIASTDHAEVQQAAASEMSKIIARSSRNNNLAALISKTNKGSDKPSARQHLDRLLEQSKPREQARSQPMAQTQARPADQPPKRQPSSNQPLGWTKTIESFNASDEAGKLEIIADLSKTPGGDSHGALREIAQSPHPHLKNQAIQALVTLNSLPEMLDDDGNMRQRWLQIIWRCETDEQKIMLIDALAKFRSEWAMILIEEMCGRGENPATLHAGKILKELK